MQMSNGTMKMSTNNYHQLETIFLMELSFQNKNTKGVNHDCHKFSG